MTLVEALFFSSFLFASSATSAAAYWNTGSLVVALEVALLTPVVEVMALGLLGEVLSALWGLPKVRSLSFAVEHHLHTTMTATAPPTESD